jgi:cilia- and flagella-associated protein 53
LRKLEAHKEAEEKRRAQMEAKSLLDQTIKVKREIQARQAQEELAFDLKMLEQIVEQSKAEQSEMEQRKVDLVVL